MLEVNFLAVFLAALSGFLLGGLWYSPVLFQKAWLHGSKLTEAHVQGNHPAKVFGLSFVLAFLASWVFAFLVHPEDMQSGAMYGLHVGVFWVASSFGINYLFENKSLKLWLVNAGYHTIQFVLIGLILGAMA